MEGLKSDSVSCLNGGNTEKQVKDSELRNACIQQDIKIKDLIKIVEGRTTDNNKLAVELKDRLKEAEAKIKNLEIAYNEVASVLLRD
jgi:hypothetical protein